MEHLDPESAPAWVKKYYAATRAVMEDTLRPYDLGSTQWYVLWQLANNGPTAQRDLLNALQIEAATLSEVVSALVRKGFVKKTPSAEDQRQRVLTITPAGLALWRELPDPIALILKTSLGGVKKDDVATVVRVLKAATGRLQRLTEEMKK